MLEIFHAVGILPSFKLLLKRLLRDDDMYGAQYISNAAGILSGPF